ncbi:hypothetical protein PR048_009569, partial [Dryococelus australis]
MTVFNEVHYGFKWKRQGSHKIRVKGKLSASFEVKTGVKQGDCLSPLLFTLALKKAMKRVAEMESGLRIGRKVHILAYVDYVVLLDKNKEELRGTIKVLGDRYGYSSSGKIEDFKYLGGLLNERNIMEKEIVTRIQTGNRCSFPMGKMLKSKLSSRTSRLWIFKIITQPVVLYGAELWTLTKIINNKLIAFENGILKKILAPLKRKMIAVIKGQRLKWYGHIIRRGRYLVKDVVKRCFEEKRPRGRPRLRWLDAIKEVIRKADISEGECSRLVGEAMDRLRSTMPPQFV